MKTKTKLNSDKILKLKRALAKQVLEGMDLKSLEVYAFEQLFSYYDSLSELELLEAKNEIFDEHTDIEDLI